MPKSSSLTGTDRYNFLLALTGYLINHRQQPIEDVAKHFQVTAKEIRSAVVTISLSGVGGYRPDELFFLDYDLLEDGIVDLSFAPTISSAPRLSSRQAAAISSGLSFLLELVDESDREQIKELITILGQGAKGQSQMPFMVQPDLGDSDLALVRQAVAESRAISCSYINSAGVVSSREIEPIRIESRESSWYLKGYCRSNREIRIFRLDRMREIVPIDGFVASGNHEVAGDEIYSVNDSDTEVLFEVDPEAFSLIADYKPEETITGNETVKVQIRIGQLENLGRIVARYSGKVRVLAPEVARRAVWEFARVAAGASNKTYEAE